MKNNIKLSFKFLIIAALMLTVQTQISFAQISRSISFSKANIQTLIEKAKDNHEYQKIKSKDLECPRKKGKPELPVKYLRLLISPTQEIDHISVNIKKNEIIKLSNKIYPSQPEIPTSIRLSSYEFVKPDIKIYESENPYPKELIKVVKDGYFDGSNHIVTLEICPWQYYPKQDKLEFISELDFNLIMKPSKRQPLQSAARSGKDKEHYDNALKLLIDNDEDIYLYNNSYQKNGLLKVTNGPLPNYEYVIITSNSLAPYFSKFISWKKRKGLDIGLVTVEEISANYSGDLVSGIGDLQGKIRQYLKDSYETPLPPLPHKTKWALLGGDYSFVPVRYGAGYYDIWSSDSTRPNLDDYKIPADIYFADFDGDWDVDGQDPDLIVRYGEPLSDPPYNYGDAPDFYPEIYVGRLLCSSEQDILTWTEKLILYEQNPGKGNTSYLTKSYMSEADYSQMFDLAEDFPSILTSFTIEIDREIPSYSCPDDTYPYGPTNPSGSEVITEMNNRYGLWGWFGDGEPVAVVTKSYLINKSPRHAITSLDNYNYHVSETGNGLNNLTNQDFPAIVYSIACDNTPFDDYNPMGWWSNNDRNLGEAFTVVSNVGGPAFLGNTRLGWGLISARIFQIFGQVIENGYTHLGEAELLSKNGYPEHYCNLSHNLVGCPETRIWTAIPSQFSGVSVTVNSSSVTVSTGVTGCDITVCSVDNGSTFYSAQKDLSSFTFNTSVRPLFITITKPNYLPYCAIISGTITSNTKFFGSLNVLGNLIVQNGVTLTIDPGTSIKFLGNSSLTINGTLNANGDNSLTPITFDFIAPYVNSNGTIYNGIVFNSTSSGTVNYCQIRNAYRGIFENGKGINISNTAISNCTDGIYLYSASPEPTILQCNIHHNSNTGITVINSSPFLYKNYIQYNPTGVNCSSNSSPLFGNGSTGMGNDIRNNTAGVVNNNNTPRLGNTLPTVGGYNNLVNYSNNVVNTTANTIYARNNWWGTTNPANFKISGLVTYSPYRPSQESIQAPPLSKANEGLVESLDEDIPMLSELDKAYQLLDSKNFSEAREICLNLVNNYPAYSVSFNALNLLKETYTENELSAKKNIFETISGYKSRKDLYAIAEVILSDIDKENKIKHLDNVLNNYKEGAAAELAMFNKFVYYYFELEDIKNALAVSKLLDERFPKSNASIEAHKILGDEEYYKMDLNNQQLLQKEVAEVPKEFILYDNYPNPFNPATVIKYAIPQNSKVILEVYSTLGEKVVTLVNETKSAGFYETSFNGSNLSSGIYIYRLTANSLESGEQFVKSAKMMLIK